MSPCTPALPGLVVSSLAVLALGCASGSVTNDATPLNAPPACPQNVVSVADRGEPILLEDVHALLVRGGREIDASSIQLVPAAVRSEIRNRPTVERALERNYPRHLRDAGIGGQTLLNILIDESGRVLDAVVLEPSGRLQIDRASVEVARVMEFSPVVVGSCRAAFVVTMPIVWASY